MYSQMNMWRQLVDAIDEKVTEYCNEADLWEPGTQLWTNAATGDVVLGEKPLEPGYEGRDVDWFTYRDEDGDLMPDLDLIEDYASGWCDFRQLE